MLIELCCTLRLCLRLCAMSYRHFLYLLFLTVFQLTQQRFLCPILFALPQRTADLRADCPCSCGLKRHHCSAAGQRKQFTCCLQIAPTQDDEAIVWQAPEQDEAQVSRYMQRNG